MANRCENSGNMTDFIFLGSKVTAVGGCSHEIKRHLLLARKAMTSLDSILKSRNITLLTQFCFLVKVMVFPVVMYGCVEKAMATHSSTLAWKIPWMEQPGRLQSMGSLRV